jgi:ABC-type antimicrobial peptide transport system permease subunit
MCAVVAQSPGGDFMPAIRTLSVTPLIGLFSLGTALFIGIFSSLLPAWSASRTTILDALRYAG